MNSGISNIINKIYDKSGFLEKYGGSIILTMVIMLIFLYYISYYFILNNLEPIKADWVNERCKPYILPFASLINKPDDQDSMQFTNDNFTYCIQTIIADLTNIFLQPIYYITSLLQSIFKALQNAVNDIRGLLNNVRESIQDVSEEIMSRILNILTSLQFMLIKIMDFFGKVKGVLTASIYTLLGSYYSLQSLVGAVFQMFILILLMLLSIIIPLLAIPFGFGIPIAVIFIIIFILISVPLVLIYVMAGSILNLHVASIPGLP
jgi:hypothetical protein